MISAFKRLDTQSKGIIQSVINSVKSSKQPLLVQKNEYMLLHYNICLFSLKLIQATLYKQGHMSNLLLQYYLKKNTRRFTLQFYSQYFDNNNTYHLLELERSSRVLAYVTKDYFYYKFPHRTLLNIILE